MLRESILFSRVRLPPLSDLKAVLHLAADAELLCPDDLHGRAAGDDGPEEERGRERGRIVRREHNVVEYERQAEVENVRRPPDEVVDVDDAGGQRAREEMSACSRDHR